MGGAYHHDRHRPFLVFLVEHGFIAVRTEIKAADPRRRPSHLLTDGIQGYTHAAFDDEFIVDVAADEAVRERPHGVHEDVPRNCLDDVLHELGTVGFDAFPLFCAADTLVSDGIAAKLIDPHLRLHIAELPPGGQDDEKHTASVSELDAVCFRVKPPADGGFRRIVHIPPELHDVRIRGAPCINERLKLLLGKPHLQGAHRLERADRPAIAEGEFGDLAFLPEMGVLVVFLYGNVEHRRCAGAVNIAVVRKDLPYLNNEQLLRLKDALDAALYGLTISNDEGPFGSQLHKEDYVTIGTPIVTIEHLGKRIFTEQNLPHVSEQDRNRLDKYILRTGDIVFSRVGSVDRCSFVDSEHDGWMFSGRCLRVRPTDEIYPLYLYYFFCLEETKQFVRNIAVGATMPSINTKLLGALCARKWNTFAVVYFNNLTDSTHTPSSRQFVCHRIWKRFPIEYHCLLL